MKKTLCPHNKIGAKLLSFSAFSDHNCSQDSTSAFLQVQIASDWKQTKQGQKFFCSIFTQTDQSIKENLQFTIDRLAKSKSWPLGGFNTNTEALGMSVQ